jgi:hypothetical protein
MKTKRIELIFNTECVVENYKDAYIKILEYVYWKYPEAIDQFVKLPKHGEKGKRYLAKQKKSLYPNETDLIRHSVKLKNIRRNL